MKKEKLLIGIILFFINFNIIASSNDLEDPLGLRLAGFVTGLEPLDKTPSMIIVGQVVVPILPLTYNVKTNFRAVRKSGALL